MKKSLLIVLFIFGLYSCRESVVKKPDNLIKKEVLIEVITDLSVLEAIQSHNPALLEMHNINPYEYVYNKYGIDSLQLAQSNIYYASNIKEYDAMYEKIKMKLEQQKAEIDSSLQQKIKKPEATLSMDSVRSETAKKLNIQ
jgi:hypothetical protein